MEPAAVLSPAPLQPTEMQATIVTRPRIAGMAKPPISLVFIFLLLTLTARITCSANPKDAITVGVDKSTRQLQVYRVTHSLADLHHTLAILQVAVDVNALTPQRFVDQRRILVGGFVQLLKAIETAYDPSYNPNDPHDTPMWGLPIPETIADPKVRAGAVKDLADNDEKVKRAVYYHDVKDLDLEVMSTLDATLKVLRKIAPDNATPDFAGLDAIVQQGTLSATRRTAIDSMIYERAQP